MNKKNFLVSVLVAGLTIGLTVIPCMAIEFNLFGRPVHLTGYITQGAAFGLHDDYDTEQGLQMVLMNLFAEADYRISDQLKFYGASMLTADWIYQLKSGDNSWHDKLFAKSKGRLNVDDADWQLLKEAHLTWTPGDFMFRVGKQIVAWGETDGFRLMDQINPLDQRRGFADVQFETTVIPIWLVRAEYHANIQSSWLQELGFQFIFNPNAEFIRNQGIQPGNDVGGIWAPNVLISGPFPFGEAHLGSIFNDIKRPKAFNHEGYEYGFRIKGAIKGAVISLNYYYGLDKDPVTQTAPIFPKISVASDGKLILHPFLQGKYPLFRFVGATFSRDITPLQASFLGGVAPVVRLEAFYAFNNTFATNINTLDKSDEFRAMIGADWKVKIPFLNFQTYFTVSPQLYWRKIIDYPSIVEFSNLKKDNYATTLMVNTSYFHSQLTPVFFWMYDITTKSHFFKGELTYDYSDWWRFTLGSLVLTGEKKNQGFQLFDNKDQIYFKISYKFS
jgi:hypothetical protein